MAVMGSLLLNFLLVSGVTVMLVRQSKEPLPTVSKRNISPDMVKVVRKQDKQNKPEDKRLAEREKEKNSEEEDKKPSFMKTSEEQEAKDAPKDPAYIGERNTRLASEREANPDGLENLPSVNGHKKRSDSDLSLIDQRGQMGELEHNRPGKPGVNGATVMIQTPKPKMPPQPPLPEIRPQPPVSNPTVPIADPSLAEKKEPVDTKENKKDLAKEDSKTGEDQNVAAKQAEGKNKEGESVKEIPDPRLIAQKETEFPEKRESEEDVEKKNKIDPKLVDNKKISKNLRDIMKTAEKFNLPDPRSPLPASPRVASATPRAPSAGLPEIKQQKAYYDPALAGGARPGYRSEERKTRISGRMSASGIVAADVQSTPLGVYQAMFLRALNRNWDAECVNRRDFIIPGSLKIRFLLNKNGTVSGIRLLSKAGTSEVQKGFTFKAIKDTRIPEMSSAVRRELGEDDVELVIDFFF